ncbi:MAG: hypothetical protein ACRD0O_05135 [Acidimicrobiia bacterium]
MMTPGEDHGPDTGEAAVAGPAAPGSGAGELRETGGQVMWGVWKMFIVIIAAFLGAMAVEGIRALL